MTKNNEKIIELGGKYSYSYDLTKLKESCINNKDTKIPTFFFSSLASF